MRTALQLQNDKARMICRLAFILATALALGSAHQATGAALRVTGWGQNNAGQATPPGGLTNAVALATGSDFSLALRSDGSVVAWGDSYYGQINVPPEATNIAAVAAGASHGLALQSNGTVLTWGYGGNGLDTVPGNHVAAIAAGSYHSLMLLSNGTVVAWGDNNFRQCDVPLSLTNARAVAAGFYQSLALTSEGTVVAWGSFYTNVPAGLSNVAAVAAGPSHSLAVHSNGTVTGWSSGPYGPVTLTNVAAIGAGNNLSLALLSNGTVVAWGNNDYGQTNVPPRTNAVAIATRLNHILMLAENLSPSATAQTITAAANNDLAIFLRGTDPDRDILGFRITSLPASVVSVKSFTELFSDG